MKKIILTGIMILAATFILTGCTSENDGDAVVISERFFVNEMLEVVLNHQQYLGRTLQFEGMFRTMPWHDTDRFIVMRYHFGCCGEEPIGLEVVMNGVAPFEQDAWVEVTGTLDIDNGFLVLRVTSIVELEERGLEVVRRTNEERIVAYA
jgi:putative membrane protein